MTASNPFAEKQKMLCRLQPDSDGYPPVAVEGLWVRPQSSGSVILDNIPFFAKGLAPGDELGVKTINGEIWFDYIIRSSGVSVFRIHVEGGRDIESVRGELLALGLPSEVDGKFNLIAVEVPLGVDIRPMLDYLMVNQGSQRFDFEEGVLRHSIPD